MIKEDVTIFNTKDCEYYFGFIFEKARMFSKTTYVIISEKNLVWDWIPVGHIKPDIRSFTRNHIEFYNGSRIMFSTFAGVHCATRGTIVNELYVVNGVLNEEDKWSLIPCLNGKPSKYIQVTIRDRSNG